jgi:ribonucleoside-diphosphate reductase alpha chain
MINEQIKKMFPGIVAALDNPSVRKFAELAKQYADTRAELESALRACQNQGFHPGPVDALRFRLPINRKGISTEVALLCEDEQLQLHIRPGNFDDGRLGEVFLSVEKQGSFTSGMIDAFSIVLSLALQYGVPLEHIVNKLENTRFGKIGVVGPSTIRRPTSVIDYVAKWIRAHYLPKQEEEAHDGEEPDATT